MCILICMCIYNNNENHREEGFRYGLKLSKHTCGLIATHPNASIHFEDNAKVFKVRLAAYLGCRNRNQNKQRRRTIQNTCR